MITRRGFLKAAAAGSASLFLPWGGSGSVGSRVYATGSPQLNKWVDPLLSAIPVLQPGTITDPVTGAAADYYEIYMAPGRFSFSKQLPVTAAAGVNTTWGYGATAPYASMPNGGDAFFGYLGPTIEARKNRPVVVKYINNLTNAHPLSAAIDPTIPDPMMSPDYANLPTGRAVPHLHGGFTAPQFDGHPYSWFTPNGQHGRLYASQPGQTVNPNEAVFIYSNQQPAANLWYHDHAMGITRLNVYAGLAALYFVRDDLDTGLPNNPLGLPAAPYEIPLVIQDKQFNPDGSLFYPTVGLIPAIHPNWVPEFFGDTPVINGRTYPFLNVEARRYRFRIVNGSQARFYNLRLAGPGKANLPLWVIGMEQSLLPNSAVALQTLLLAPGERADVIVDFTGIKPGTSFILSNDALVPYPGGGKRGGPKIPDLMKFNVVPMVGADLSTMPAQLVLPGPGTTPLSAAGAKSRQIILKETMNPVTMNPTEVRLNQLWFADPVDDFVAENSTEVWQFVNLTVDAHPMHMHLVQFKVLNRQPFNVALFTTDYLNWVAGGRQGAQPNANNYTTGVAVTPPAEENGLKDTVKAYPGQITRVVARFDLPPGVDRKTTIEYVYHCHILEHEENEMMRPFQVTPDPKASSTQSGPIAPQFVPPATPVP